MARFGKPEIFNTDQGAQFTAEAFTSVLRAAEVRISMDGRGRYLDNVFVERLWRSLKYEEVYLHDLSAGPNDGVHLKVRRVRASGHYTWRSTRTEAVSIGNHCIAAAH